MIGPGMWLLAILDTTAGPVAFISFIIMDWLTKEAGG